MMSNKSSIRSCVERVLPSPSNRSIGFLSWLFLSEGPKFAYLYSLSLDKVPLLFSLLLLAIDLRRVQSDRFREYVLHRFRTSELSRSRNQTISKPNAGVSA